MHTKKERFIYKCADLYSNRAKKVVKILLNQKRRVRAKEKKLFKVNLTETYNITLAKACCQNVEYLFLFDISGLLRSSLEALYAKLIYPNISTPEHTTSTALLIETC